MHRVTALLALLLALPACDDSPPPPPPPPPPPADTAGPPAAASTVRVWFHRGEDPVAVERRVTGDPLEAALESLVAGPTADERAAGIGSWFSDTTRSTLRSVREEDGRVVLDFTRLPALIPNASTSAGSAMLLASLDSTVFQFDRVRAAEYRLDGSCDAFWEWLQRGCTIVRREP